MTLGLRFFFNIFTRTHTQRLFANFFFLKKKKSLQFILADNTQPRLSQLGGLSKRHYLNRKKSRQGVLFPIADGEPDMFNNSTLVDVTSSGSNNNFL